MRTVESLKDISDGKIYDINDIVKADARGCSGCSDCCKNVGDLVVLNPHDVYEIVNNLGIEFDELIGDKINLRTENKIQMPYLNMKNNMDCSFLDEYERCSIHGSRPNICRLFPLGRMYIDNDVKYFLQVDNCPVDDLGEVNVSEWIGIENYDVNKVFVLEWYKFIKALTFRLKFVRDEEELCNINEVIKDNFYRNNKEVINFYDKFFDVLPKVKNELGII